MTDDQLLEAIRIAAGVPADGWGVTWNPLTNDAHCAGLIVSHRVRIEWMRGCVTAHAPAGVGACIEKTSNGEMLPFRRAVVRAVIGGAA